MNFSFNPLLLIRSQEWSMPNFLYSLTRNITSHSMKNLAFHSVFRRKMIILPILTTWLIHSSLKGRENVLFERGSKGVERLNIQGLGFGLGQRSRQPFHSQVPKVHSPNLSKEKYMGEVVRIGSVIIFYLSKLWKAKFSLLCDVIFLERLQGKFEIYHPWDWKG